MEGEVTVERITEKKIIKPAPPTEELYDMIERFRGLDKEGMIKLYNHPNCSPSWTPHERRVAKNAMLMHLKGTAPAPRVKANQTDELDEEIRKDQLRNRPKSQIELEIESEMADVEPKAKQPAPPPEIPAPAFTPVFTAEEEEKKVAPAMAEKEEVASDEELPVTAMKAVPKRKPGRPMRDLIPEKMKK